jgi:hypothetical protein
MKVPAGVWVVVYAPWPCSVCVSLIVNWGQVKVLVWSSWVGSRMCRGVWGGRVSRVGVWHGRPVWGERGVGMVDGRGFAVLGGARISSMLGAINCVVWRVIPCGVDMRQTFVVAFGVWLMRMWRILLVCLDCVVSRYWWDCVHVALNGQEWWSAWALHVPVG